MKFNVHKNCLIVAINNLNKITATQNQIEVFKQIQIDVVKNNQIKLTASNGTNTLIYYIDVMNAEGESILINAKDFLSIINKLDGLIEFDNGKIICGKSVLKLPYRQETFYQDVDFDKKNALKFNLSDFKKSVKNRLFAVSDESYNNVLSCVCIEDNQIASTNGNVLTVGDIKYNNKERLLLDKLFITSIINCMDADFELVTNKNQVIAFNDNCIVITMTKTGQYPKYKSLIPKHDKNFTLDKQKIINVLELLQVMLHDESKIVILEAKDNCLSVRVEGNDRQGKSLIDVDYSYDETFKIAFNVDLLLDCCKNIDDDTLTVEFDKSLSPTIIKGENDLNLIMPIQMRNIS